MGKSPMETRQVTDVVSPSERVASPKLNGWILGGTTVVKEKQSYCHDAICRVYNFCDFTDVILNCY